MLNENSEELFASIRPGDIAIDCGANVGEVTQRLADKGAFVFAFEPNPFVYQALWNRFKGYPNVICINKGVWHENYQLRLYLHQHYQLDPVGSAYASSILAQHPVTDTSQFVVAEIIDLTQFIDSLNRDIKLVKIDIEGAEFELLEKMVAKGQHKRIEKIVVETHEWLIEHLRPIAANFRKLMAEQQIHNIDLNWV
ncbi:FkbM family methyltransferase [Brevibacillus centrosporus]|uniref:Methyltransferase, FkbM family n=1 Tax=Brevibacillus centrosporus TaxID=54910 RepID=A0A1I4AVV9_9BACL|nr:FkbM family methyltransferase [Brevibacillus centrosporus]SFK60605.1 methyltransferase, FkbM family [Brevibacillus centrosporus]